MFWSLSGIKIITMAAMITQLSVAANDTTTRIILALAAPNISTADFDAVAANTTNESRPNIDAKDARKTNQVTMYSLAVPALWALCCIAALANVYILMGTLFLRRRKSTVLWITFSLAAADFWASIVLAMGLLVNSYLPVVKDMKYTYCIGLSLEALRLGGVMSSVLHLLLFAVVHYMATICPLTYKYVFHNPKIMKLMLGGIWTSSPFAFFVTFSLIPGQGFQSNQCMNSFAFFTWEFRLTVFCLLLGPLLLMSILYVLLMHRLVFKQRRIRGDSLRTSFRKKMRAIVTSFLVVSSFLIAWLPGSVWYLLICDWCIIQLKQMDINTFVTISFVFNSLMILKGLVNPFIYHMRIPELREALENLNSTICCGIFGRTNFAAISSSQNSNKFGSIDSPTFGACTSGINQNKQSTNEI